MKKVLEELKRKLEDPVEIERMKKYFNDILIKEDNDFKRVNKFFSDDKTFEVFLLKLIKKHDNRWDEVCFENGCEPHPWNLLDVVFKIAQRAGDEVMPVDDLTRHFSSLLMKYRNFIFSLTFGQGTCASIYDKDNNLIFRL